LGECAYSAIHHAKAQLLKPGAQLIPAGVRVMAMLIESQEIVENHRVSQAAGFDVSAFNEFSIQSSGYMGYHLDKMSYRALSAPVDVFCFDFDRMAEAESTAIEFEILQSGYCHAVAYWYQLRLDEQTFISTAPGLPKLSSWKQAVQLCDHSRLLVKGERQRWTAHHDSEAIWFT
jgi:hypothetical protein